jgi:hypothetical protein
LALLPPADIEVREENIDRVSCGECLALLPPADIDVREKKTGRISDERSGLLLSGTRAS